MNDPLNLLYSILIDGAIFSFASVGVAIVIGWGRFADLTPDAAFTSGAVGLWYATAHGMGATLGPFIGFTFGALAGAATATFVLLGVSPLLASLVVIGLAYSANWSVLARPLRTLADNQTVFANMSPGQEALLLFTVLFILVFLIQQFAGTSLGIRLRAVAENSNSVPSGQRLSRVATVAWLALGNGMVGLSGAFFASKTFIVDINMGAGTLISGLSALLVGWVFFRFREGAQILLIAAILGGMLLHALLSLALTAGAPAEFFKAITAVALLGCLLLASRSSRNVLSGLRL